MSIDIFRTASKLDAEVIANLVNMAYRPESGASGWTHESDLVSGSRTNVDQIVDIISKPDSVILLGIKGSEIAACIHIEKDDSSGYIGMFAVNPTLQGAGVGKQMLAYAEWYASENFSSDKFIMVVVSSRSELISFYQRRGYQKTGSIMDYPLSAGAGIPKHPDLKIEILEKRSDITVKRDALDKRPINQESL
ncbi:MAG: GNAT family N-acetyltransferase [Betaproteobacteria bacterium]|nr:GNAT family N-acetyltransferase [Betaproteobacteria bacterium]